MSREENVKIPGQGPGDRRKGWLADLFHFAGANATCAYMHPYMGAVRSYRLYALDVRFRHLFGLVVGVAHLVSAELAFAANIARACHCCDPP
jgi:hypothetical protein